MFRTIVNNEVYTILIFLALAIIALAKLIAPQRFNNFLYVIGNSKYLKIYLKDQKFFDRFDAFLFCNLILSLSVFGCYYYKYTNNIVEIPVLFILKLTAIIGTLILIKVLIERLVASIFEIDTLINAYLFQKITYKNYIGFVLTFINIIVLYSLKLSLNLIYGFVIFIVIINLSGLFTSFKTHLTGSSFASIFFIMWSMNCW